MSKNTSNTVKTACHTQARMYATAQLYLKL